MAYTPPTQRSRQNGIANQSMSGNAQNMGAPQMSMQAPQPAGQQWAAPPTPNQGGGGQPPPWQSQMSMGAPQQMGGDQFASTTGVYTGQQSGISPFDAPVGPPGQGPVGTSPGMPGAPQSAHASAPAPFDPNNPWGGAPGGFIPGMNPYPSVPADPSQPGGVPAAIPGGPGGPFAGQPAMNPPNSSPIAPRPQAPPVGPPIASGPSMPGSFPGDPRNPFPGQGQPFQPMGPGHPGAMPQQPPPPPPDYSQDQIGVPGPGGGVIYPGHRRYDEFQQRQQRQQQQPQPAGMGQPHGGPDRRMIDGNGGPMPSGVFR